LQVRRPTQPVSARKFDNVSPGLAEALDLDPAEAKHRMCSIRQVVRTNDVDRWARGFLADLAAAQRR